MACEVNRRVGGGSLRIVTVSKPNPARTFPLIKKPVTLNGYLGRLGPQHLAELCLRLKLQLVQQRLPQLCTPCRQYMVDSLAKMDLNMTKLIRGLCPTCHVLFMENRPISAQPLSCINNKEVESGKVKKVIINVKETLNSRLTSLYEVMTKANIPWCRYCGVTGEAHMQSGPWGEETLCFDHGCQYHGLGKNPLNLSKYMNETKEDRKRPVIQELTPCNVCAKRFSPTEERLYCRACPKVCHRACVDVALDLGAWFCESACSTKFNELAMSRLMNASPKLKAPKPRYAKSLSKIMPPSKSLDLTPATPPPTPPVSKNGKPGRKRRSTADQVSDILICFEPKATIRRRSLQDARPIVFTPEFKSVQFPPVPPTTTSLHHPSKKGKMSPVNAELADLTDSSLAERHNRFETVEKEMRILRPEVLKTLYNPKKE